jgi:hypothetical protein
MDFHLLAITNVLFRDHADVLNKCTEHAQIRDGGRYQ